MGFSDSLTKGFSNSRTIRRTLKMHKRFFVGVLKDGNGAVEFEPGKKKNVTNSDMAAAIAVVTENTLQSILSNFPKNCSYCFAYGSAVFSQQNQKPGKMIDLVFVVDDPISWHRDNLRTNSSHYSAIKYFGANTIAKVQEKMASGVYYNPFVRVEDQLIKYGVISTGAFVSDLNKWSHLYIAGRLHKPVLDVKPPTNSGIVRAINSNREAALRTILLQSGRNVSKYQLFHGIAEISYIGDSRMKVAEHPDKVRNIVLPQLKTFERAYRPHILAMDPVISIDENGMIVQDTNPKTRFSHLMLLPHELQLALARRMLHDPRVVDIEEVMAELSYLPNLSLYIRNAITDIVWGSSIMQTIQGIISAGVVHSIKYGYEKLTKKVSRTSN